jgi:hypothetical protein
LVSDILEEWEESLLNLSYNLVNKLKDEEKPGRFLQKMMEYCKQNKLEVVMISAYVAAGGAGK